MKVVTFNTLVGFLSPFMQQGLYPLHRRIAKQVEYLRAIDADVICLQEIFSLEDAAVFEANFPDYHCFKSEPMERTNASFKYLLMVALLALIPSMFGAKIVQLVMWPRSSPLWFLIVLLLGVFLGVTVLRRTPIESVSLGYKAGLMTLVRKDKLTIVNAQYRDMSREAQKGDTFNIINPRGLLMVDLLDENSQPVRIINVHLNRYYSRGRMSQIEDILRYVEPSTVVAGDFNAWPNSPEINRLKESGLTPTQEDGVSWNALCGARYLLDYIFMTSDLTSTEKEIAYHEKLSDHFAVSATITKA